MLGTDIFSDFAINQARNRASDSENALVNMQRVAQENADLAEAMIISTATNLGMRYALARQLELVDPTNPLLRDTMLVERFESAALAAFELAERSWEAVREVGRTFNIPGREAPKLQPPTLLKDNPEQMKLAYAGVIALRNALSEQLKRFDPENPLLKDYAVQERIRSGGIAAYKDGGDNFDAAREVGRTFKVPGAP